MAAFPKYILIAALAVLLSSCRGTGVGDQHVAPPRPGSPSGPEAPKGTADGAGGGGLDVALYDYLRNRMLRDSLLAITEEGQLSAPYEPPCPDASLALCSKIPPPDADQGVHVGLFLAKHAQALLAALEDQSIKIVADDSDLRDTLGSQVPMRVDSDYKTIRVNVTRVRAQYGDDKPLIATNLGHEFVHIASRISDGKQSYPFHGSAGGSTLATLTAARLVFRSLTSGVTVFAAFTDTAPRVRAFDALTATEMYPMLAKASPFGATDRVRLAYRVASTAGHGRLELTGSSGGGLWGSVTAAAGLVSYATGTIFPAFDGGASVAAGDVTGDGIDDLTFGSDGKNAPRFRTVDGASGALLADTLAFGQANDQGIRVASADYNGDGRADVIASLAFWPAVRVFSGNGFGEITTFYAYDPLFQGGVTVAAADLDDDGFAEIITGTSNGSHLRVFRSGVNTAPTLVSEIPLVYPSSYTGGISVAARTYGRRAFVVVAPHGPDATGHPIRVYEGINLRHRADVTLPPGARNVWVTLGR